MMDPIYVEIPEDLIVTETADQRWLRQQIERIDPHIGEQGNDAGYTRALESLVFELREENQRLKGKA